MDEGFKGVLRALRTQDVCPYPDSTVVYYLETLSFYKNLQTSAKNILNQAIVATGVPHIFNLGGLVIHEQCT